jgi:SAM-dependent methyltransferase
MARDLAEGPDRDRALANYARLAAGYDASCKHIVRLRRDAVAQLALRPGETVFDVACGTGATLPQLAEQVVPGGRVIGIEQSPEMAAQAVARVKGAPGVEIVRASVEEFTTDARADAMLFSYTHDVLQSPRAIARLKAHAKPGCRVTLIGVRLQPWTWGFGPNLFMVARARHYFTTYRGLHAPWALLERECPGLRPIKHYHLGTSYLAVGRFSRG